MKPYATEDDIKMLLESDPDRAFRLIVEKFGSKLYWHIRRLVIIHADADDALQTTFIKVWRSLGGFRSESSLYTWLYSIATNEALTLIKKRAKYSGVSLDDVESFFSSSPEGDAFFDGEEASVKLQNAIIKLPEKQRIVFNMKYFDDMSYEDISQALGTSVGALKASYHYAVKKIEKYITE
ncbi:MAG TPA: RNA polymerase sigma factor [Bacteroidales bacterium]|nr:RNA polymerase sigma factor [Bacteroidales bacterium]